MEIESTDVVVVGAGNAGMCAALAAREAGARVLVLEVAPEATRGGNTAFTAGAMRVAYEGLDDLLTLMPDLTESDIANTDFGKYPAHDFFSDMERVTQSRCDPNLTETVITESLPTLQWMRSKGVRFGPIYGRQAYKVDGKFVFWGGLTVEVIGGGPGLIEYLHQAARLTGVEVWHEARAVSLIKSGSRVTGVRVLRAGQQVTISCASVVLASGGFEGNPEWRARYLGPGWDLARVRGTRYNQGEGIRMALDAGASAAGNWSGCHATAWDLNAPEFGDLRVGDGFQKHSYPLGIVVNRNGERFLDEGADFRNYTYAKYGREILQQPEQMAFQVFDGKVQHLLRDEYRIREVSKIEADTLEDLATGLAKQGVSPDRLLATIEQFNASVTRDRPFNPNLKDGRRTNGLPVDKTNWANPLDTPPFQAYAVTCGITFTFGGLRIDDGTHVIGVDGNRVGGLYACGELVGGLFYFNYPGGTGLTAGAVFGRIAGSHAAARAAAALTPERALEDAQTV